MNFCAHLPVQMNYYYSTNPPPQPRNPPGFGEGVFFHNLHNHPPVIILPPHRKPPMVTNQPEFSLFTNPDYFGFYSVVRKNTNNILNLNNVSNVSNTPIPQKEKNEVIPKLVFTDLNIASQEFRPGLEWSPRSTNSGNSGNSTNSSFSSPRSTVSTISTNSSPRSIGSPRKRIVVYPRTRK